MTGDWSETIIRMFVTGTIGTLLILVVMRPVERSRVRRHAAVPEPTPAPDTDR